MIKRLTAFQKAILALAAGIAFSFSGCQVKPPAPTPAPVARPYPEVTVEEVGPDLFDLAERDYLAGNYDIARIRFEFFLEQQPESPKARGALCRIADIDISNFHYGYALRNLKRIVEEYPDHPENDQVKFRIIKIYYDLREYEKSKVAAFEWLEEFRDNPLEGQVLFLLGTTLDALGQDLLAYVFLLNASDRFARLSHTRDEIDAEIVSLIKKAELDELRDMARYDVESIFIPNIYYRIAYLSLEEYRLDDAEKAAMALVRSTPEQYWVDIGRIILDRITNEYLIKRNAIGCLLPLTGPYSIFGQEALNGIQLGMDIFNESESGQQIEIIIKDTAGEADKAVTGVEDLVIKEKVIAIIGPLASKPAVAASIRAQELGIPIITLTQRQGITDEGDMVFRNFLTPEKEVETVLDQAVNSMKMNRFAIFYPDNPYGRFLMNRFWDGVDARGVEITAVESYDPDATDFADQIKKMAGLYYPRPESVIKMLEEMKIQEAEEEAIEPSTDEEIMEEDMEDDSEEEDQEEEEPEPIIDFDAIFIPDNFQQVALIAPQFPYYNIFNIPLLGTSLWQSDELIETAGDYIQGAIFTSGFFQGDSNNQTRDFIEKYMDAFESEPGILAANGYDTVRFIKNLINYSQINTREEFKNGLYYYGYYGVTGNISFDHNGEVKKTPLLLSVSGRRLKILPKQETEYFVTVK